MNSNRVLAIASGCGLVAVIIALVWTLTPERIDFTSTCPATERSASTTYPPAAQTSTELSRVETSIARDNASATTPESQIATPEPVVPPEEVWNKKYAGLSSAELRFRQSALKMRIGELAQPELQKMYDAGQYEMLHEGTTSRANEDWKPDVVMSLQMTSPIPGGAKAEVHRAILPESKYPGLYAMRHEERWLEEHATELERKEADAKSSAQHK